MSDDEDLSVGIRQRVKILGPVVNSVRQFTDGGLFPSLTDAVQALQRRYGAQSYGAMVDNLGIPWMDPTGRHVAYIMMEKV